MSLVDRTLRRELARKFQDHHVVVVTGGHSFRGKLRRIGRNFLLLKRHKRRVAIHLGKVIAVKRIKH